MLFRSKGLSVTRMEGANIATGEVLVFFDSHTEVQTNWLPPLLEPIAKNRRLATTPVIDNFDSETFAFQTTAVNGILSSKFLRAKTNNTILLMLHFRSKRRN